MNYGRVAGVDKPIARVVQGTVMIRSEEEEKSFALLDEVFEQGGTTFDTAHQYGGGDCERTFGRWAKDRGLRDEIIVIGKGAHHNADRKRVSPFDITADLFDSLTRFGFDHVDLYLLHRDDPSVPVGPIVEVLNEHFSEGRIKAFGGSNWTPERLREANEYAEENGLTPFVASSPNHSLAEQAVEPWPDCVSIGGKAGEKDRGWYEEQRMPLSRGPVWPVVSSPDASRATTWILSRASWTCCAWRPTVMRRTSSAWTARVSWPTRGA